MFSQSSDLELLVGNVAMTSSNPSLTSCAWVAFNQLKLGKMDYYPCLKPMLVAACTERFSVVQNRKMFFNKRVGFKAQPFCK